MYPILLGSVIAVAITLERFWTLMPRRVTPRHLLAQTWASIKRGEMDPKRLKELRTGSPLGEILAAGIAASRSGREATREAMQDTGAQVLADLERFLPVLGVVASISPLLGLLGTVLGMIDVFNSIMTYGSGQARVLAGGIAEALITTAAGLIIGIPTVVAHRMLSNRVDALVLTMEREANRLADLLHGNRERDSKPAESNDDVKAADVVSLNGARTADGRESRV